LLGCSDHAVKGISLYSLLAADALVQKEELVGEHIAVPGGILADLDQLGVRGVLQLVVCRDADVSGGNFWRGRSPPKDFLWKKGKKDSPQERENLFCYDERKSQKRQAPQERSVKGPCDDLPIKVCSRRTQAVNIRDKVRHQRHRMESAFYNSLA
jgi:hypothetical protein